MIIANEIDRATGQEKRSRRLRILLNPSAYYPHVGGVEEVCRNLARVIQSDFDIAIATNRHPLSCPETEIIDGVTVRRFTYFYPNRNLSSLSSSHLIYSGLTKYIQFLRSWAPDLVHVVCPSTSCLYTWVARRFVNFKLLVSFHGELFMDEQGIYEKSFLAPFGLQRLLNVADAVQACSQFVLADACERFDVKPKIRQVIYNGVQLDECRFAASSQPPVAPASYVLAVGRLAHNKRFDLLIRAFANLANRFPQEKLVIAGDGTERAALESLAMQLGITDRVIFTGRLNREQLAPVFAACKFLVLSSPLEPFGIVCLEAMRAGKPVIASNAGGPPEFIADTKHGYLVQPGSAEDLSRAMQLLLADDALLHRMGAAAKEHVNRFDWPIIGEQYATLYRQLCS